MAEDGYLLLRGLHDRDEVLTARRDILTLMAQRGLLDASAPLMDGVVQPDFDDPKSISVRNRDHLKTASLKKVVYGRRLLDFFDTLLGGPAMGLNFQWLRTAGPGASLGAHYDIVFMGRGTHDLYTCWTPFGDLTPAEGTLAICLGAHRWEEVRSTYGQADVDRDLIEGLFTKDPSELVTKFGGRWATTTFRAGDVLILGMFTMHASMTNTSNRFRISCDTRYQRQDARVDERWAGDVPVGHQSFWAPDVKLEPLEVSRQRWGV